jgi:hypothetical protein
MRTLTTRVYLYALCIYDVTVCYMQHYALAEHGEWRGWHCEGGPLRALFPLLMWDVLFMDVPGE